MNVLDLFSGIGGFSLGLERAGMRTVAFCEIDPYCRRVLAKHWPSTPIYDDVRTITAARLAADGIIQTAADTIGHTLRNEPRRRNGTGGADPAEPRHDGAHGIALICGGFPCQDISVAGKGAGIGGARSGLWLEYARIIGEVRPRYVIVENVAALLVRGMGRVLGDLSALGYDAEWSVIRASDVGAPHRRARVWIVAYPARERGQLTPSGTERQRVGECSQSVDVADAIGIAGRSCGSGDADQGARGRHARGSGFGTDNVADADEPRSQGWPAEELCKRAGEFAAGQSGSSAHAHSQPSQRLAIAWGECGQWLAEPAMGELVDGVSGGLVRFEGRVARGVPDRVNKLRALGNAVVPQIPEIIGRAIMSKHRADPNYDTIAEREMDLGTKIDRLLDDYDGEDDFAKSIDEAYRVIRERKANGGKGWTPP